MAFPSRSATAVSVAAIFVALVAPMEAEPSGARARRSPPIVPPSEFAAFYLNGEFAQRAEGPRPFSDDWEQKARDRAAAVAKQLYELEKTLQNNMVPQSRRAEGRDAAVAIEMAKKMQAMQQQIQAAQLQARLARESMLKKVNANTDDLRQKIRSKRATPYDAILQQTRAAMELSYAAARPGLEQMNELIRIRNGAPLYTVRLPGFPSHLFLPGKRIALPGFLEGLQMGQDMLEMSMRLNAALNGGLNSGLSGGMNDQLGGGMAG